MVYSQSLPYNPTSILLSQIDSSNKDIAYVFLSNAGSTQHQFLALNISSTISASNLSFENITPNLPFLNDDTTAFIPSIDARGDISVYTGSCSTNTSAELWRFTPSNTSRIGNGTWDKEHTTTGTDVTSSSMPGADFLSRGFSFSSLVHANASQTTLYTFGGMCPISGATTTTWQSSATYSNHMLRLFPTSDTEYILGLPPSRGPPISEAGFTITGLTPTYSNGSGVMTQQQSFVLLGGHTQTAFINMSQVAIWSLPLESWSFVTIDSPSASKPNTELTVKSTVTSVDSRSGHTAVLTEDGSSIIVYGGWVGDVNQAADPQLAVLSLGTGFGGEGDWEWSIPEDQPSGAGIYGHGAVMLPGNIMMVLGGYNISGSGVSKRDSNPAAQVMFYNATSMTWMSNYTNPAYVAAVASDAASASSSAKSNSKKIGLGVGLGLGFAAIIGTLAMRFCYNRQLKRRRHETAEKDIRSLSATAANYYSPNREVAQRSSGFPWANGRWNGSNGVSEGPLYDSTSAVAGYENLNSGVHGLGDNGAYPAPPKQISRTPLYSRNARGLYQPTPTFDFNTGNHGRANSLGTAGPIHPIYEADEEDHNSRHSREGVGVALGEPGSSETNHFPDPFRDPPPANFSTPLRKDNRSVSTSDTESPARSREREIQEWVSDWAAADALLNSQARFHSSAGRVSPTRRAQLIAASTVSSVSAEEESGRTASNLSDRSVAVSAMTVSRSGSSSQGRSRSNSLRGFINHAMNPLASTATTGPSASITPIFEGPRQQQQPQLPRSAGSSSSFTTAQTSFPALQSEGEGLLPRPDDWSSPEHSPTRSSPDEPGSPSKSKGMGLGKGRGQSGWLGSLRKVFTGDSAANSPSPEPQTFARGETSPVRVDQGLEPRRTVSAGATLWRRKQGKSDWEDSEDKPIMGPRSNTFTGDWSAVGLGARDVDVKAVVDEEDEEEWDIERAVQNRVVQVMFTVPKEKLRVVNHDVDEDLSEVGSLRSKKGSGKSLKDTQGLSLESVVEGDGEFEIERVREQEVKPLHAPVPVLESPNEKGKGKGKVLEIVEDFERRASPEHR